MKFVLIKQDNPLWENLWNQIENHPINEGVLEPSIADNQGNKWEYRGSFLKDKILISDFLHRKHPKTNEFYKITLKTILKDGEDKPFHLV